MIFVDGDAILVYAGVKTPNQVETEWAALCADAVNDSITTRLNGAAITNPPPQDLVHAALMAGGETYKRRETPFGITGFADGGGEAIRLSKDYIEAIKPMIDRYSIPGIA